MLVPLQLILTTETRELILEDPMCDWLSGSYRYRESRKPRDSGKTMKIDRDGCIEWETQDWESVRCPSSDTSIRVRCNGQRLQFSGNIGRFQEADNVTGLPLLACVEKYGVVLRNLGFELPLFGACQNPGTLYEFGTTLSRVDLAANFQVSDYKSWVLHLLQRPISRRYPRLGKYGPTWGYESRRSNWWKAKVYDKSAEIAGKRAPNDGETLARFEVQLGSEYLKRENLNHVAGWNKTVGGESMAKIIYGRFLNEIQREPCGVEDWSEIPPKLRAYAILWRDGQMPVLTRPTFYRVRAQLKEYGIDIAVPCNVLSLTRRVRYLDVVQQSSFRSAA